MLFKIIDYFYQQSVIRYIRKIKMKQKSILLFSIIVFYMGATSCKSNKLKDIEGNEYRTVTIGTQVWIAENLKTTKFNDGTSIPMVSDNEAWVKMTTPAYSWYNNDSTGNKKTYGALYNWNAVNTNKLCPAGWHVPTDGEWQTLTLFLDGFYTAGGKMKEKGTKHWKSPNIDATNESGFTALPAGYRSLQGIFNYIGISAYWWSSTSYNESSVLFWNIRYRLGYIYKFRCENFCGFSVRCVKD
jgi:uncharacterized protein (TIGR02145 family)